MLTKEQIEAARTVVIVLSVAQCGETPKIGADERDLLLTSLAAYERAVALLDGEGNISRFQLLRAIEGQ